MEIEKPVLQQPPKNNLKCYHDLSFNPSPPLHQHQDISKTEAMKKVDDIADDDNGHAVDSDNDNNNDNSSERRENEERNHLFSEEIRKNEKNDDDKYHNNNNNNNNNNDDDDNAKSSITDFKQQFSDFDDIQKEQEIATTTTTTTTIPDLDNPEFSSFQHHFSMVQDDISRRNHAFFACKLLQHSSDSNANSISINDIQEEIPELEEENSQNSQEKSSHLESSSYSSSPIRQQHRRSDRILDEKRPRIERPRARYPNSARRTSAPACLWFAPSLLPDQQSKSTSSLHDNLILLHKLLAKQRIIHENVAMPNFDPSVSIPDPNDDHAAAAVAAASSQSETSSTTIAPHHFPTTQTSVTPSTLATWQWLRES
ncbi:unnamed protein product [Onchocerca ochengi]|uniref:Myb domain-containing protein n=1 Tax=Onchocerca ochengi TaxID=42157 RepID=A0A182EK52_ONCOC|nr:unnamed protein product [Onchocerca ochengi]